jgi:hypothetical protein
MQRTIKTNSAPSCKGSQKPTVQDLFHHWLALAWLHLTPCHFERGRALRELGFLNHHDRRRRCRAPWARACAPFLPQSPSYAYGCASALRTSGFASQARWPWARHRHGGRGRRVPRRRRGPHRGGGVVQGLHLLRGSHSRGAFFIAMLLFLRRLDKYNTDEVKKVLTSEISHAHRR